MATEILEIIKSNGIWVFLVGLLTSIIIGVVKTPIYNKVIKKATDLTEEQIKKRESLFDTVVFLSTYVIAFIAATIYSPIAEKGFNILHTLATTLPIWLSQSLCYGIWKKLSLKRLLQLVLKLFIKDSNGDGKISLDEALKQVKGAYKNGKLDIGKLVADVTDNAIDNLDKVIDEVTNEVEVTKEMEATVKAVNGDSTELKEMVKDSAETIVEAAKDAKEPLVENTKDSDVAKVKNGRAIEF